MSAFLSSLLDNAELVGDAWADAWNPTNWVNGTAPLTADAVKRQVEARGGTVAPDSAAATGGAGGLALIGTATQDTAEAVVEHPVDTFNAGLYGTADSPGGVLGGVKDALKLVPTWAWVAGGGVLLLVVAVVALPYVASAKQVLS